MKRYTVKTSPQLGQIYRVCGANGSNYILEQAIFKVLQTLTNSIQEYHAEGVKLDMTPIVEELLAANRMRLELLPELLHLLERIYFTLVSFIVDNHLIHNDINLEGIRMFEMIITVE